MLSGGAVITHSPVQPPPGAPLLDVRGIDVVYRGHSLWPWATAGRLTALRELSFDIACGETFALVGESGSGKSTAARAVAGLVPVRAGRIRFAGQDITRPIARRDAATKRRMQIVFQNPDASLNPRHSVATILGRPLAVFHGLSGAARRTRAGDLLADVQLDASYLGRMPRQLSGGERQRVALARALAAEPELLLCDEILSALDVSVQARTIGLLRKLQDEHGLAYLFISHDLAVVRWLAHRVGVLFAGTLCEIGPVQQVFSPPYHPYTESLLLAVPRIGSRRAARGGTVVEAAAGTHGCPYAPRCTRRIAGTCDSVAPPLQTLGGHAIRCHVPAAELAGTQQDLSAGAGPATPVPAATGADA
jgi:peptide/nickel transport system ATP-binding protein